MRAKVNQPAGLLVSKKRRTKVGHYRYPGHRLKMSPVRRPPANGGSAFWVASRGSRERPSRGAWTSSRSEKLPGVGYLLMVSAARQK